MAGHRSSEKEEYWKLVVAEWRESGLNIRKFCNGNGIRENSFYAWRRELEMRTKERTGNHDRQDDPTQLRQTAPVESDKPAFLPLTVKPESKPQPRVGAAIEIIVGQHSIRIQPGFDSETLQRVMAIVSDSAEVSA